MTAGRTWRLLGAWVLVLGGCTSAPVVVVPVAPTVELAAVDDGGLSRQAAQRLAEFERRTLAQAQSAEAQGRLADAALAWELLTVLNADSAIYRDQLARLRIRQQAAAAERLAAAAAAQRRGELDLAAQGYLEVLSLQPEHAAAADALRAVERERNRRSFVGKFSRNTLTRRAVSDGEMRYNEDAPAGAGSHLEHATLLARQGEFDSAIGVLKDALRTSPQDAGTKTLLIDVYLQKAERAWPRDARAARGAVDAALALDPRHAGAQAMLRKIQGAAPRGAGGAALPSTGRGPVTR